MQLSWACLGTTKNQWYIGGWDAVNKYHVRYRSVAIQCIGIDSEWRALIESAATLWNNSGAGVQIRFTNEDSTYTCELVNESSNGDNGWLEHIVHSDGILHSGKIQLNLHMLAGDSDEAIIGTIAHEFGHLFGLSDCEDFSELLELGDASLMSYQRNRNETYSPKAFDIRNLYFIYE